MADEQTGEYRPVRPEDVTDEKLMVGEFRAFRAETRTSFELLTSRIIPMLERIEGRLDDALIRIERLERGHMDIRDRVNALEQSAKRRTKGKRK